MLGTTTSLSRIAQLSAEFAQDRRSRQLRRELDPADFERLTDAGFLRCAVPREQGGEWVDTAQSTRSVCELLRTLARGDSSVALVASMHPAVLGFWLTSPEAPAPFAAAWQQQRRQAFQSAAEGAWWGTITSEPGSGGDVANTKAIARPAGQDGAYTISGQKHFGSGSGITSFMLTSAVPAGEAAPDWFLLDVRGMPWDGTAGVKLLAAWDGHGMTATQSHAFQFDEFPATRFAWSGDWRAISLAAGPLVGCCFTAVVLGILEIATETARDQLARRRGSLRAFEQVEWARAEVECWLSQQAFEGMLRAVEQGPAPLPAVVRGKMAIAELAESALQRICRVIGGGTYARQSPFGCWLEDVRALGFLRPPWGVAYDMLFEQSWAGLANES